MEDEQQTVERNNKVKDLAANGILAQVITLING
jgi:hypothetical protein